MSTTATPAAPAAPAAAPSPAPSAAPAPAAAPSTPPAIPAAPTPPAAPSAPAAPAAPAATPPTTPTSPTSPAAPSSDGTLNLLDDPQPAAPDGSPAAAPDAPPDPEAAARKQTILAAIPPVELALSDGRKLAWDNQAVDAVAEVFARHGVAPEVAKEAVDAYAARFLKSAEDRAAAAAKKQADANASMVKACRDRFGADLPRYAEMARKGGLDIFGDKAWGMLRSVPAFTNNPDILAALAARGRAITNDPSPRGAGAAEPVTDMAAGLYRSELANIK